ncbi:hypothetical protein PoB_003129700 [Plakobranchus ocellatus]|uniref:Uncharacterized protein n=1 Tax=Plakobranchus ocellatus TaxID=259542 RepID=A0AAV4AC17_9GAST|nr:hypothetical protein PoB_003129700 [Plakobranchus ocellatus]
MEICINADAYLYPKHFTTFKDDGEKIVICQSKMKRDTTTAATAAATTSTTTTTTTTTTQQQQQQRHQ